MNKLKEVLAAGGVVIGVDVDTQYDFVNKEGSLFVPAGDQVLLNLQKLTRKLQYRIGSVDHHGPDAWEFVENGGPFPVHCLKGTLGANKIAETMKDLNGLNIPTRFVPMSKSGQAMIGESIKGAGPRVYSEETFVEEVLLKKWTIMFEKEVYSLFSNENAEKMIEALVKAAGGVEKVYFVVYGYCTGGFCVDAAAEGLKKKGYNTGILVDATAAIGGEMGEVLTVNMAKEKEIDILTTEQVLLLLSQ